jgi:hypothetical protein
MDQYIISSYPDPAYEQVSQEERVVYVVHGAPTQGYGTVTPHGQFPGQQSGTTNAFTNKQPSRAAKMAAPAPAPRSQGRSQAAASSSSAPAPAPGAEEAAAHSSNPDAPPPTYADAIKGDNKIQSD